MLKLTLLPSASACTRKKKSSCSKLPRRKASSRIPVLSNGHQKKWYSKSAIAKLILKLPWQRWTSNWPACHKPKRFYITPHPTQGLGRSHRPGLPAGLKKPHRTRISLVAGALPRLNPDATPDYGSRTAAAAIGQWPHDHQKATTAARPALAIVADGCNGGCPTTLVIGDEKSPARRNPYDPMPRAINAQCCPKRQAPQFHPPTTQNPPVKFYA